MKKNLILSLLFAAACSFAGFNSAQAQTVKGADVPAMQADVQTMADEVMANQLNDPDEANKTFAKLVKKIKNDKEQLVAVGNFFLEKKIYPCANQCAKQAYTIDPQYVPGLMLQAQVCMLRKDWGGAGQKFDEILNIQPDNIEALRLSARVYKFVNPIVAKEALAKILEREPNNLTAYKELGDIAYTADEFKEASAAYKKYFDGTPNPTIDDVHTGENYVISLMNQSDFTTIKDIAEKLLKLAPSDLVLRRMLFYAQVETMDFEHAKEILTTSSIRTRLSCIVTTFTPQVLPQTAWTIAQKPLSTTRRLSKRIRLRPTAIAAWRCCSAPISKPSKRSPTTRSIWS